MEYGYYYQFYKQILCNRNELKNRLTLIAIIVMFSFTTSQGIKTKTQTKGRKHHIYNRA